MVLSLKPIESKDVWERFLLSNSPEALFQSWLWGDVQKKSGQTVYRFGLFEGSTLEGIAQVFIVRAKRGTFLHVRHGPVWATQKKQYWGEFIELMRAFAKKEHAWFLRVSPLVLNSPETKHFFSQLKFSPAPTHEVDAERCWVLDIDRSEEELLQQMRKTTRYEIRRAQKLDVRVTKSTDPKDLHQFYALYAETSKRHGFVAHQSITEEFELFARDHKAMLLLGFDQTTLVASTIVLFYGNQAIYHHGASIASKVPVSYVVQWEAIREAKKRGIKLYNFYGIAPEDKPNHPWRGITLFKKGFGGNEINYIHAQDYAFSPLYIVPKTIEGVRKRLRGY